ncbi:hypothetical protein [Litoreibacter albidus]|uniref:hypothetical protein n=1 Tax=Litoreibacter albidus TaxID=670155 RepID=UPI00147AD2F2|nr:hypothetical protein [Litoreibacter albidus]
MLSKTPFKTQPMLKVFGIPVKAVIHAQSSIGKSGLEVAVRRCLHEGPLLGSGLNFAKVAICALLTLVDGAARATAQAGGRMSAFHNTNQ